jgi:hypothetical protein
MYINTVANCVMLKLYFIYAMSFVTIFEIKHKLDIKSGSAPLPPSVKNSGCAPAFGNI